MTKPSAASYAAVVQKQAEGKKFDPLLLVSMIQSESEWDSQSNNGKCYGLGGICLSNYAYCRKDVKSTRCEARRQSLLHGPTNIRIASFLIAENRRFCKKKTGSNKPIHWLQSYQGFNSFNRNVWCGQSQRGIGHWEDVKTPSITAKVLRRYEMLKDRCVPSEEGRTSKTDDSVSIEHTEQMTCTH
jgi:hypothetical protein